MSTTQAQDPRAGARGHAILIEDVAADRGLVETFLRAHGYSVSVHDRPDFESGLLASSQPRLVLLSADVKNGFNLCLRFKKDAVLRRVPLVLMTAKASPEVLRKHRLLATRADAYLTKPLTEAALLAVLTDVLPEDFGPDAREVEPAVVDVPDRTLVSGGTLETAVVNFVEEEVRTLKDAVDRLMSEKTSLGGKVVDLETQLRSQRQILDSGLQRMTPRPAEAPVPVSPQITPEDLEDQLEAARKEAYDAGIAAGRVERRQKGLEQGRREGRAEAMAEFQAEHDEMEAEISGLRKQLEETGSLRKQIEEAGRRLADLEAREAMHRNEMAQTTSLFERLEGGYKDALAKAEAERGNADEALARAEAERDELAAKLQALQSEVGDGHGALAERDRRIASMEEELRDLRQQAVLATAATERVPALEKEVADLGAELEAARESLADLEPLRRSEAEVRKEVERLRDCLVRARAVLDVVGPEEELVAVDTDEPLENREDPS